MRDRYSQSLDLILLIVILIIAGVTRMLLPGMTEFKGDEARLLSLAWEMATFQSFPLRGISSSAGFPNFPAAAWLYSLPLLVVPHVYAATLFTGLLNTLAVGMTYFFTNRYFSRIAALVASFMFAVSPWAIVHSRKIWAQNLLPIFVLLWAFSAAFAFLETKSDRTRYWVAFHILIGFFAFQIHLAAGSLLLATFILLIMHWQTVELEWILIGLGLAFISALPFVAYLATAGTSGFGGGDLNLRFSLSPIYHAVRLTTGWELHSLAGPLQYQAYLDSLLPYRWLFFLWGGLVVLGAVATWVNPLRPMLIPVEEPEPEPPAPPTDLGMPVREVERSAADGPEREPLSEEGGGGGSAALPVDEVEAEGDDLLEPTPAVPLPMTTSLFENPAVRSFLVIWCLAPIVAFLFFPVSVELHYLLPLYPAVYILAGVGVHWLLSLTEDNPLTALISFLFVCVLAISAFLQVWNWYTLFDLIDDVATPGGFGVPLAFQLEAADEVARLAANETYGVQEIIVAGRGENPEHHEFAAVYRYHLHNVRNGAGELLPVRFINIQENALFPTHSAIVITEDVIEPLSKLYERESQTEFFPTARLGDPQPSVFLLRGNGPEPEATFDSQLLLNNFVRFTGYDRLTRDAVYQLYWTTGIPNADADYHIFNHLLDGEGIRLAQADAAAFSSSAWREGDLVVSRFELSIPADKSPALIRSGMYLYPAVDGIYPAVPVLDVAGNPAGDWFEVPVDLVTGDR